MRRSLASQAWKRDATQNLKEMLKDLAASPEGRSVVGLQVAGGVYGEWHPWATISAQSLARAIGITLSSTKNTTKDRRGRKRLHTQPFQLVGSRRADDGGGGRKS